MGNVSIGPNQEYLTSGREYLHSRVEGHVMKKTVVVDRLAADQPGSILRKGYALAKITTSGKYKEYDNDDSDGTEVFRGFLDQELDMKDLNGVIADQVAQMVVFGRVKETNIFMLDLGNDLTAAKTDAANGDNGCFFVWD